MSEEAATRTANVPPSPVLNVNFLSSKKKKSKHEDKRRDMGSFKVLTFLLLF